MKRAIDPGNSIWSYRDPTWVVCPSCAGPARVSGTNPDRRLTCARCGHVESSALGIVTPPLYLTGQLGRHQLWAYNLGHIDALIDYLSATLRERGDGDLRNKTMMSRLPAWMKAASARPRVLKALGELRERAVREGLS